MAQRLRRDRDLLVAGLVLLLLALAMQAIGQDSAVSVMELGNRFYEDENYEAAVQTYRQLIDQGWRHPVLHYNLGNAHYRSGDLGRAILNYERAARLAPRDADVRANLALARSQTVDQLGSTAVDRLALFARSWLTVNEMALLTWSLWLGLCLLLALRWVRSAAPVPRWNGIVLGLTAILLVGGLFSLGSRVYVDEMRPLAIIVALEADVRESPDPQSATVFTLHSGSGVSILDKRRDWVRVALPGGDLQGWLAETAVEPIAD